MLQIRLRRDTLREWKLVTRMRVLELEISKGGSHCVLTRSGVWQCN